MKRPGVLAGALVGGLLTAPLVSVFYLVWKLAGGPFPPFDVFDRFAGALPGSVITFGIDAMVRTIRAANLGSTADVAKTAEQTMAVALFVVLGIIVGAVLFGVFRALPRNAVPLGVVAGAILGVLVVLAEHGTWAGGMWTVVALVLWGSALGLSFRAMRTPAEASVERLSRRSFLIRLGGASAAITVAGAVVGALGDRRREPVATASERWSAHNALPNAGSNVRPAPGTRPELTPLEDHYRIDIDTTPPVVDEKTWRLKVGGLVDQPRELTLDDIRRYEPTNLFVTLSCISNPVAGDLTSTTRWTGVSLQRLLPDLELAPNATHLKISSADGFFETVALDAIANDDRVMLAYAWDGVPLPAEHGFPLRIYIPDRYGMKQPKWIESIDAIDQWEAGYWVVRGWDREARMKATSVIDTVATDAATVDGEGRRVVPVGGIAHAGARGISKVEVRVDDGDWREAQLREPLSGLTWVVWRYDMPFEPGDHTFTVRCYDGNGTPQIAEPTPPHPDGATGLDTKTATLG